MLHSITSVVLRTSNRPEEVVIYDARRRCETIDGGVMRRRTAATKSAVMLIVVVLLRILADRRGAVARVRARRELRSGFQALRSNGFLKHEFSRRFERCFIAE